MDNKIEQFWQWFSEHEKEFRQVKNREEAIESMNNQVLDLGMFYWEIGPGDGVPYYLIISPNGDAKRFQSTQSIINAAPSLDGWEFHACKPPKDWDFNFKMYDSFMLQQTYNAKDWGFIIDKVEDQKFKISLLATNLKNVDPEDIEVVGNLVATNILGEEIMIEHVQEVTVILNEDEADAQKNEGSTLTDLYRQFTTVLN